MERVAEKSRREKRKETRLAKQKNRFHSWLEHQRGKEKKKNVILDLKPQLIAEKKSDSVVKRKEKSKSMFQEYLELEMGKGALNAEEDLEMERKLAKKLNVKTGKLGGLDDGINFLIGASLSEVDSLFGDDAGIEDDAEEDVGKREDDAWLVKMKIKRKSQDEFVGRESGEENLDVLNAEAGKRKRKRKKSSGASAKQLEVAVAEAENQDGEKPNKLSNKESSSVTPAVASSAKYVAPQKRSSMNESEELTMIRRQVKRLLNKISESNVESVTAEMATIFRSLPRSVGCQIIAEEFLASSLQSELFFAPFAAIVAGMACSVGIDFSAKLIEYVAKSFEDEYLKGNGHSLKNLTKLLCNMYIFGVYASDLIYDLLGKLSKRFEELDVSVISTVLEHCGMKIRVDDPTTMKDFIVGIRNKINELRSLSADEQDGVQWFHSKRVGFMLDTICDDIKNNKKKPKEEPAHYKRLRKWLQKLRSEDTLLRGIKWSKLLDPEKKGQWWISGEGTSILDNVEDVATTISKEVQEAQKFVQLAAAQRMNTDTRRAIFCIIMSAEDYIDAFEKLLRLDLPGKQDREIIRVLVDCCLYEKVFNKYYTVLASKLCSHDKNNKFSLQYCIWDCFKELESMELTRSMNLARFAAEMLSSFSLSLAVLKVVDLTDATQLTPKRIMHFRMLFEAVFEKSDAVVWNIFTRIAAFPELEMLRNSLVFFIKQYVVSVNSEKAIAGKFKIVNKALNNVAGVLM